MCLWASFFRYYYSVLSQKLNINISEIHYGGVFSLKLELFLNKLANNFRAKKFARATAWRGVGRKSGRTSLQNVELLCEQKWRGLGEEIFACWERWG